MSAWFWLGLAILALIGEIASGTFYLLVVAAGMSAGALISAFGFNEYWQVLGCASMILLGLYIVKVMGIVKRSEHVSKKTALSLDVGAKVEVKDWNEDGTTTVFYRGAQWQAILATGQLPEPGIYTIKANQGNALVLEKNSTSSTDILGVNE